MKIQHCSFSTRASCCVINWWAVGTFWSEKGSTLGTEKVLWMPSLVQSSHYFLWNKEESNGQPFDFCLKVWPVNNPEKRRLKKVLWKTVHVQYEHVCLSLWEKLTHQKVKKPGEGRQSPQRQCGRCWNAVTVTSCFPGLIAFLSSFSGKHTHTVHVTQDFKTSTPAKFLRQGKNYSL